MIKPTLSALSCQVAESCLIATVCAPKKPMPCIDMRRVQEQKLKLCDELESIADDLPTRVDRLHCLTVASSLLPLLRVCHRFEEETIFPAFKRVAGSEILDRLVSEHLEDEGAAEDLTEILLATGHGRPIENAEAFGYMLRAFFESLRRHIAFERDHVLPVVAQALD